MAGRALTPATRRSLGEPLPHQLADRKIADPKAINLCSEEIMEYYPQFPMAILHLRVRSISLLTLPPLALAGQATKCMWWMPWRLQAMKDVIACDKLRLAGK